MLLAIDAVDREIEKTGGSALRAEH